MNSDLRVSERYAEYHPGYKLLNCEEAILPISKVTLHALTQEKVSFSPIEEFVLKGLGSGIGDPQQLFLMLGLDADIANRTLTELWQRDLVDSPQVEGVRTFRLTRLGEIAVAELRESISSEQEVIVYFDRLLRKPIAPIAPSLEVKETSDFSEMLLIGERRPGKLKVDDLKAQEINLMLENSDVELQVLAIKQIVSEKKVMARCELLIFESLDAKHHLVDVVIDGRINSEYGKAIESLGICEHLGLRFEIPVTEDSSEYQIARETQSRIAVAPVVVKRHNYSLEQSETGSDEQIEHQTNANIDTGRPLEIDNVPHRFIDTFEHPEFLQQATSKAEQRLLIISPWVTDSVVNNKFIDSLRYLARKGVLIHIGYGIEEKKGGRGKPNNGNDKRAEERLERLASEFPNVVLAFLGNTHAKVLLWDNSIVLGSFNWLSFRGDQNRTYRQELSTYAKDSSQIDALWAEEKKEVERIAKKVAIVSQKK